MKNILHYTVHLSLPTPNPKSLFSDSFKSVCGCFRGSPHSHRFNKHVVIVLIYNRRVIIFSSDVNVNNLTATATYQKMQMLIGTTDEEIDSKWAVAQSVVASVEL